MRVRTKRPRKSKRARKVSYRKPSRPSTWDSPKGWCRLCGEPIIEQDIQNKRKNWHQNCLQIWLIANQPDEARKFVYQREQGRCGQCDCEIYLRFDYAEAKHPNREHRKPFQVDHIRPLFENTQGDFEYFRPENLIALCVDCHGEKTAGEAARRANDRKN